MLDFDSHQWFLDVCLIFKVVNSQDYYRTSSKSSRVNIWALNGGDCNVQRRSTRFSHMVAIIRETQWTRGTPLPAHVRNCDNYTSFKKKNKKPWNSENQADLLSWLTCLSFLFLVYWPLTFMWFWTYFLCKMSTCFIHLLWCIVCMYFCDTWLRTRHETMQNVD